MKTILLTQNQVALVDDEDYERLNQYKWFAHWNPHTHSFYAVRNTSRKSGKRKLIYMAREILGLKYGDKRKSDHKNHITLDNQRCNLRVCSHQQNNQNRRKLQTYKGKKCSSKYVGIYWHTAAGKWLAQIGFNGKHYNLGYFTSEVEAAKTYDTKALELFGEYANLNF